MELLIKNSERPLTRREMAEYVWQNAADSTNIVDVYINFLRKKIESITPRKYIHTVRGIGYILKEEDEKTRLICQYGGDSPCSMAGYSLSFSWSSPAGVYIYFKNSLQREHRHEDPVAWRTSYLHR